MTEQLERSLERSLETQARLGPDPHLDLDRVRARGRRHARRRTALVGGVAAAVVLALGVPLAVSQLPGSDSGRVAVDGPGAIFADPVVSWAEGSRVRAGDLTLDVGADVIAYVLTDRGVVAVDPEGRVRFADGTTVREIGSTGRTFGRLLVSDGSAGPEVAWYDAAAEEVVVYDTSADRVQLRLPEPVDPARTEVDVPTVRALDDGLVWVYASGSATAYDTRTGDERTSQVVAGPDSLDDARGSLTASEAPGGDTEVFDWARPQILGVPPGNGRATLSAGGDFVTTEGKNTRVFTVGEWEAGQPVSGDDVTPDLGRYVFQRVVRWLDDDRYQAFAFNAEDVRRSDTEGAPLVGDFLVCSVVDGACTTAATDEALVEPGRALPTGEVVDGAAG